jgi:hypothetical protein
LRPDLCHGSGDSDAINRLTAQPDSNTHREFSFVKRKRTHSSAAMKNVS